MTQAATVGDIETATRIAAAHIGIDYSLLPESCDNVMRGDHRTVYVDVGSDVVYKIGYEPANRREYKVLTQARLDGKDYAPPVTLYEVTVYDHLGDQTTCTVVAMPYLPEDGSVDHKGLIFAEAGDLNPSCVHAHGGQLWLVDAGGLW
jgi:hypothetical protein